MKYYSIVKSATVADKTLKMTDDGTWYYVVLPAGQKSFFGQYSDFADASYVFDDQLAVLREVSDV